MWMWAHLVCKGLPACERAHVLLLIPFLLGIVYGQRGLGSPLCQHAAEDSEIH